MVDFEKLRVELVKRLKAERVIRTPAVERAFLAVPREEFVPDQYRHLAYEDHPLPIPCGQTISAPHMCAIMCEALSLKPGDRVLEVGTGSGYHAALCAEIVAPDDSPCMGCVVSLEYYAELARYAWENLKRAGYGGKVFVVNCDGSRGPPSKARFNKILVTAAASSVPPPLLEALDAPGAMVIPVGGAYYQELMLIVKKEDGTLIRKSLGGCIFVSLRGKYGMRRWW